VVEYPGPLLVVGERRDVHGGGDPVGEVGRVGLVGEGRAVPVEYLGLGRQAYGDQEVAEDHCGPVLSSRIQRGNIERVWSEGVYGMRYVRTKGAERGRVSHSPPLTRHDVRAVHHLGHDAAVTSVETIFQVRVRPWRQSRGA